MRKLQLDLLRAMAILLVLGHHMSQTPTNAPYLVRALLAGWRHVGWTGVDLFFVLSGFLVSGLLFKEYAETGEFKLWRFLIRRGLKIYPSYYVFLLLALPAIAWWPGRLTAYSFTCEALFVGNYLGNIWDHTWSLAVEEHFYLLLSIGFLVACGRKDPFRYFVPACYAFLVIPLCLRLLAIHQAPFVWKPDYSGTAFRLDELTFGVLLSYYYHHHEVPLKSWVRKFSWYLVALGLVLISPCAIAGFQQAFCYTFGITLLYLGWGVLLLVAMSYNVETKNRIVHAIANIGVYSYSIYLWHKPFSVICTVPNDWWPVSHMDASIRLIVYFVGALFVGITMSKCIEWPMLHLRDRLFPARYVGSTV